MKKQTTTTQKPAPKAKVKTKIEQPVILTAKQETPEKPVPKKKAPKKVQTEVSQPVVATPELTQSERVGLTAGSLWNHLDKNGASPVAKLIRELPEEEKIIQRSIGWLAQEGKITIETVNRVEIISLR